MQHKHILHTVCAIIISIISGTANAAIVSQITPLNIGGTLYDVTFHNNPGDTFSALWDADNDGSFGGGSSLLSTAPTFFSRELL